MFVVWVVTGCCAELSWVDRMRVVQKLVQCELWQCILCRSGETGFPLQKANKDLEIQGGDPPGVRHPHLRGPRDSPHLFVTVIEGRSVHGVSIRKHRKTHPSQSGVLYEWGLSLAPPPPQKKKNCFLLFCWTWGWRILSEWMGLLLFWAGEEAWKNVLQVNGSWGPYHRLLT